ncbi:MAG: TetR/AcrR family transcriptional regulator [Spirochaetaceae bacterium]|nr:MAG: TetR/AcrR family transcriptional regulator [Spirochaetaceae bacterium]
MTAESHGGCVTMPKDTFFNLPIEKRERFIEAALDEFSLHDYRTASVSRIVAALGIAKGSVYQYFDDKKELYRYLVTLAAETKFSSIDSSISTDASDFFARFKQVVFHGARFDFSRPRFANILYHATYEPSETDILDISAQLKESSYRYIRGLVDDGVKRDDLRKDLDVEFVVFALYQLTISLRDFLSTKFAFSFKDAVRKGKGSPISDAALNEVIDRLIEFFRSGIGKERNRTRRGPAPEKAAS